MNFLIVSKLNSGAGASKLRCAINKYDHGHVAKSVTMKRNKLLKYRFEEDDVYKPSKREFENLIKWSDIIVVTGVWSSIFPSGPPKGKIVIANYRGTPYRREYKKIDKTDLRHSIIQSACCLDLVIRGRSKHWLPIPIWVSDVRRYRQSSNADTFRVVQPVTKKRRFGAKRTRQVQKSFDKANDDSVTFEVIHNVPRRECLKRMAEADLVVTGFRNGFGCAGLEAMAMGIPIIADGFDEYVEAVRKRARLSLEPFFRARPSKVYDASVFLRDNPVCREVLVKAGHDWLNDFHRPSHVVEKLLEIIEVQK